MIKAIVFDIGGVFLHAAKGQGIGSELGFSDPALVDELLFSGDLWNVYKRGGMTEEAYWKQIIEQLPPGQLPPGQLPSAQSWEQLCAQNDTAVILDEELAKLARELNQSCKIHALSNAGAELERRLRTFGIDDLFGEVINSHRVKMAKPDEEIYHYTCERIGAAPEEILFVDDKVRNTLVADAVGYHTHVYTGVAAFRECLAQTPDWDNRTFTNSV